MITYRNPSIESPERVWRGPADRLVFEPEAVLGLLQNLDQDFYLVRDNGRTAAAQAGAVFPGSADGGGLPLLARVRPIAPEHFGNPGFLETYGVRRAYMAGSMANAISNEELVIAMGKARYLASFGSGGVSPDRLEAAIHTIQSALPDGPYAFNLIHSPQEPALEQKAVDLFRRYRVGVIEASAFLRLTPPLVEYRAAGLEPAPGGKVKINQRVIGKLSRGEVAQQFLQPAPEKILRTLVNKGKITARQAELASRVPVADDITVEADSGGHTDNRPLTSVLPSLIALRDQIQAEHGFEEPTRVGAAGGIGTPTSVLGAFTMGADYVVTGSINQACLEAGTSDRVKALLAEAGSADVIMAPAADMFEMGVKVQVLKRGTMFPMRAQKLYDIYQEHDSLAALDPATRTDLEEKIFQRNLDQVWEDCVAFFEARDPDQLEKARRSPRKKMALIFRWYLGLATHWGIRGEPERAFDYQIWCGPAMGAFNDWTAGTRLADPDSREIVEVAQALMEGAAYLARLFDLKLQGVGLPPAWGRLLE